MKVLHVILLIGAALTLRAYFRMRRSYARYAHIPGPKPFGFFGSVPYVLKNGPLMQRVLTRLVKDYGRVALFYPPYVTIDRPFVVVSSAKDILKFSQFTQRLVPPARPQDRHGIQKISFWRSGEEWRTQRKMLQPLFGPKQLRTMVPLINECLQKLTHRWNGFFFGEKCEIDARNETKLFTLDVMGMTGFAHDFGALEGKPNKLIDGFTAGVEELGRRLRHPLAFLRAKFPSLFAGARAAVEGTDTVFQEIEKIIQHRRSHPTERADLLKYMMDWSDEDTKSVFTQELLLAESFEFLFAGYDTTSNTLSTLLHFLAKNPKVQEKIFQEIKDLDLSQLAYDDFSSLKYLCASLSEAQRLQPITPFSFRVTDEEVVLGDEKEKEIRIPPHSIVMTAFYPMQHDPEVWGPDAEEFVPERWLSDLSSVAKASWMPFGFGLKSCVGFQLALLEARMFIACVCKSFVLEIVPGHENLTLRDSFTVQPDSVVLRLVRRS